MHSENGFEWRLMPFVRGSEDSMIEGHLKECPQCRETLDVLRSVEGTLDPDLPQITDPPASLQRNMIGLYGRIRPDLAAQGRFSSTSSLDQLKKVWAICTLDSRLAPVAGLRSAITDNPRQLAFTSEVADLDLEITQQGSRFLVLGQLGMDVVPPGLSIQFVPTSQLLSSHRPIDSVDAAIADRGHFQLTLDSDDWVAVVAFDGVLVVFPKVEV